MWVDSYSEVTEVKPNYYLFLMYYFMIKIIFKTKYVHPESGVTGDCNSYSKNSWSPVDDLWYIVWIRERFKIKFVTKADSEVQFNHAIDVRC